MEGMQDWVWCFVEVPSIIIFFLDVSVDVAQLLAVALGGEVQRADAFEFGWHTVRLGFPGTIDPIYAGVRWESTQFHMHGHSVSTLPPGATPVAASQRCPIQAFRVGLKTYGVQYHFEWSESDIAAAATDLDITAAPPPPYAHHDARTCLVLWQKTHHEWLAWPAAALLPAATHQKILRYLRNKRLL